MQAKRKARRKAKEGNEDESSLKRLRRQEQKSVLAATEEMDTVYRPKTKDTRAAYEELLSFVQGAMGDQQQETLRGAADEVILQAVAAALSAAVCARVSLLSSGVSAVPISG